MLYNKRSIIYLITGMLFFCSCKKYLDQKPFENLLVPKSVNDLQAVLDNTIGNGSYCQWLEFVADNYYVVTNSWNNLPEDFRTNYIWAADAKILNNASGAWNSPYAAIFQCNFVLDLLPGIAYSPSETDKYKSIQGTALFTRAHLYNGLAQVFCNPYSNTTLQDPGLVLRLNTEILQPGSRATVEQTYERIIDDLKTAIPLLPNTTLINTRPTKAAAYGLLSRVYLFMREYEKAGLYADSSLAINSTLLDYNTLGSSLPSSPFAIPEISYLSYIGIPEIFNGAGTAIVDTILYQSYAANDLRKKIFFGLNGNGRANWKGCYSITPYGIFDGIITDEIYLNRAESYARAGDIANAMTTLNTLLRSRYQTGTFTDLTATDAADALQKVLVERRKELLFRGIRWSDLRRFNLEGANITIKRIVNNTTSSLAPNDKRWVLQIPEIEISRSGIEQNPR